MSDLEENYQMFKNEFMYRDKYLLHMTLPYIISSHRAETVALYANKTLLAHSTGQNLNTGVSQFSGYETGIQVFQKQFFFNKLW
jgi:hypothetical protein